MRSNRTAMRRRLLARRPSTGMILAVIALVAALAGTAVAGGGFLTKKKFQNQAIRGPITYAVTTTPVPTVPATGNSYVTVSATCPGGTKVIGGGIKIPDATGGNDAYQNDSYATQIGWAGNVSNYSTAATTATTVAVCVSAKSSIGSPPAS
jgi:hypothetical protein